MRITTGIGLLSHSAAAPSSGVTDLGVGYALFTLTTALLLLLGLWTPVAGVLAAIATGWHAVVRAIDPGVDILFGIISIALALLGPGAWSLDARLFGWKRFEIRDSDPGHTEDDDAPSS